MHGNGLPRIVVIAGTTASGKSALAIDLARKYNGEIVSADSRQVYKGFDLCSGKVSEEERKLVPHHLLDICDIGEKYSVFDYQKAAYDTIAQISEQGRVPFLVGGTGLYIASVVQGYVFRQEAFDPGLRSELEAKSLDELWEMLPDDAKARLNASDKKNKRRIIRLLEKNQMGEERASKNQPQFSALQLGVTWPREILYRRIEKRLKMRLEQGMIEEVRRYLESGGPMERLCELGLEYRHIAWYLAGKYASFEEFQESLARAIQKFAKRQTTWFKKDDAIHWLDMEEDGFAQACGWIEPFLS